MDIEFEWARDAKGYEFTDKEPQVPPLAPQLSNPFGPGGILAPENRFPPFDLVDNPGSAFPSVRFPEGMPPPPPAPPGLAPEDQKLRIVRLGGSLVRYRADLQGLSRGFEDFINVKDAEAVREFYRRWGPLGSDGNEDCGEAVWYLAKVLSRMNQFVNAWSDPDKAKQQRFIEKLLGPDGFDICDLRYALVVDPQTRKSCRRLRIPNLFAGLWIGMIEVLTNENRVLRRCAYCNELFTAGEDSNRRLDSRFCSDQHRVLYHRQKNAVTSASPPGEPRRRDRPRSAAD
jgi:hypothetical protein